MESKYYKYIFQKDIDRDDGVIRAGSEVTVIHGCLYFNGGLMDPYYAQDFWDLIHYEDEHGYKVLQPYDE